MTQTGRRDTLLRKYILWILFFPTFWGLLGGNISFGQIIYTIPTLIVGMLLMIFQGKRCRIPLRILSVFIIPFVWYCIALNENLCFEEFVVSFNDYTDVLRPIIYLITFITSYNLCNEIEVNNISRFIMVTIVSLSIFDILKFIPTLDGILKLYTPLAPGSFNYLRFSGTFAYCYNYAYILIFGCLLALTFNYHKFVLTMLTVILILLSGSRAGILAILFSLLTYSLCKSGIFSTLWKVLFALLLSVLLLNIVSLLNIPLVDEIFDNFDKLVSALSGEGEDGSLSTRSSQLESVLSNFDKNPLFGVGPQKKSVAPIEIQIGYYLSSWGIVGLVIYLGMMSCLCVLSYKGGKSKSQSVRNFSHANCIWIISSFIIGFSTPITDQIRVSQFFFTIQGIQYYLCHKKE